MEAIEIIKKYQLRSTRQRILLLSYFMNEKRSICFQELENNFRREIDRVSIYRILQLFLGKGVLCKIVDSKGKSSFVFSYDPENKTHPHFKCNTCDGVVDLPDLPKEYVENLRKYNIDHFQFLAEGTCDDCQSEEKVP